MAGKLSNLKSWIPEALNADIRIVLVHDKVDEATESELQTLPYLKRIQLATGKYGSPGEARNMGLSLVQTEWVTFWDSDDLPSPLKYLDMVTKAEESKKDWAIGRFKWRSEHTGLSRPDSSNSLKPVELFLNPGIWRFAFRTTAIPVNFSNHKLGEDQLFLARCHLSPEKGFLYSDYVYEYSYGGYGHLVDDKKNLGDLLDVVKLERRELKKETFIELDLAQLFLIKQCITILKKGNPLLRLNTLNQLLLFAISNPRKRILVAFKVLRIIVIHNSKVIDNYEI